MDNDGQLREPDHAQIRELFARHRDFLAKRARAQLARMRLPAHHDDDIVAKTIMTVITKVLDGEPILQATRNWRAYLTTISQGHVQNLWHEARKKPTEPLFDELCASGSVHDEVADDLDRKKRLALFNLLPEPERTLLISRFDEGLSPGEAAAAAKISAKRAQSIYSNLRRKVELVERDGSPRGASRSAVIAFAQGLIALRNERADRD